MKERAGRFLNLFSQSAALWIVALFLSLAMAAAPAFTANANETCGDSVKVKRGDTLGKIAKRCEVSLDLVMLVNPEIRNPNLIFVGQRIQIPTRQQVEQAETYSKELLVAASRSEVRADPLTDHDWEVVGIPEDSVERWIDVDISTQTVSAYEGRERVETFLASTGVWRTPTVTGKFEIYLKFETDDMRGPGYFLKDVPFTMYFHKSYGLHGTYWHDNFGTPMSNGCVNLTIEDAEWLYEFAEIGTVVYVRL